MLALVRHLTSLNLYGKLEVIRMVTRLIYVKDYKDYICQDDKDYTCNIHKAPGTVPDT